MDWGRQKDYGSRPDGVAPSGLKRNGWVGPLPPGVHTTGLADLRPFRAWAAHATELAHDEPRRLEIAHAARKHVERLGEPESLWKKWRRLFAAIG